VSAVALGGWLLGAATLGGLWAARRALARCSEAAARACHEVRGSLTTVRLGLSLATRAGGLSAEQRAAIDTELGRATLALEDLGRARVRSPHPTAPRLERVSLTRLLADAVTASQGRAAAAGGCLFGGWEEAETIVWGDRLRLAQALDNLIANAIDHGGGAVRVSGRRRAGRIQVVVDDDGPGLPAPIAVLARRPRAGRGRRGRGLAIATAIAELHGGSLTAAPVGRGGRVVLELPATPRALRVEA
jgi:signal transduction histidine kinase